MIPDALPKTEQALMSYAPRYVVHLRAQHQRKRLGMVFGAGLSAGLGFPNWQTLVERLAKTAGADADALLKKLRGSASGSLPSNALSSIKQKLLGQPAPSPPVRSLASITHMLFGQFRRKYIDDRVQSGEWLQPITFLNEQKVRSEWMRMIHRSLYHSVDDTKCKERLDAHPYLKGFLQIIQSSPLTVNYNFDDSLERLLHYNRPANEQWTTRGYETTFRPYAQFQRQSGIIYHPNGFLPSVFEDGASPDVVFADDSFQDQIIGAATGRYSHLTNFIQRNTCLLIGLSLEDAALQNLLRQNAIASAGHVHYIVHYIEDDDALDRDVCRAIFDTNYSVYNLITLFLNNDGIRSLTSLISMGNPQFALCEPREVRKKYVYYVIGSVGAGKTTTTNNFRNLHTYDEWIEERRPDLTKPESQVPTEEKQEINKWVASQFRMKNYSILATDEGIHLIDRCPLDPLTFGEPDERKAKAKNLYDTITDGDERKIEKGHVIFLDADDYELQRRISFKHRYWPDNEIRKLVENIKTIYGQLKISTIATRGRDIQDVVREVSRIIFVDEYAPVDIGAELTKVANSE